MNSTEPSEECTGQPRTLREGVFTGTIEFRGERGFVQLEGPQAEGSMSVLPPWRCPEPEGLAPFAISSRLLGPHLRAGQGKKKVATLYAASRHCLCLFGASVRRDGSSTFFGVKAEEREGMKISRATLAEGKGSAFLFDHAKGTATLKPPPPLSGRASFAERPGRVLWRSTIRVPLPGAGPLRTDGPGFKASLSWENGSG